MKYLIVRCTPLCDQYECDADREPVCMTDDPTPYGYGYEVYEVQEDGSLVRIKEMEDAREEGMALYRWHEDAPDGSSPEALMKFPNLTRWTIPADTMTAVVEKAGFTEEPPSEILAEVISTGSYGEEINGYWVVFGEYRDNRFDCGY